VYGPGLRALVYREDRQGWFHAQGLNDSQEYLSGHYRVEVLTVPRVVINEVEVKTGEETLLDIPAPGIVNLDNAAGGFGSIYVLSDSERQTWVQDINITERRISVVLQPGKYRVVFRAKNAPGSKYTSVRDFEVKEGQSSLIKLF
jgi:Ca-activated chloride channel family protein